MKQLTRLAAASLLMVWLGTGCGSAYARTCTSLRSGLWKTTGLFATWKDCGGGYPGPSDDAIISDGDTVKLDASLSVTNITINSGGKLKFDAGDRTLTVKGDVTNNGSIQFDVASTVRVLGSYASTGTVTTAGFGTVSFNGTTRQTVSGTGLGFFNVTMNNANGISLSNDLTVNGTLTFIKGKIITGANKVTVGTAGLISRADDYYDYTDPANPVPVLHGYVAGFLEKLFPAGDSSFTFHIGDDANTYIYAPVTVSAAGAPDPVTNPSDLKLSTTPGDHPNIGTSSISPDFTVNRYWTITSSAVPGTIPGTYRATFNFPHSEIDMGAVPANFQVQRYALPAGPWSPRDDIVIGTRTATSTQATGLTATGGFAIGEFEPKVKNEFIYLREIY